MAKGSKNKVENKTVLATVVEIVPEPVVVPPPKFTDVDVKELADLKALADGLGRRGVVVDSKLQKLIEQLEQKLQ